MWTVVWAMGCKNEFSVTYRIDLLDGDRRAIAYEDRAIERRTVGGRFKPGELNLGRAVRTENLPTIVQWGGPKRFGIPDCLFGVSMFFVSTKFRHVVEEFEPGVHQFVPVEILWKDGTHARSMFFFHVCNRLDSVDHDVSTAAMSPSGMLKPKTGTIVFSETQIGSHHIWHDKHIYRGLYVSDALHDELIASVISGLSFSRRESI